MEARVVERRDYGMGLFRITLAAGVVASLLFVLAVSGVEAGEIILGQSDGIATDQPRGAMMLYTDAARTQWLGNPQQPDTGYTVLFDTGANGILVFGAAADEMGKYGYQTEGTYVETGVTGDHTFNVSAPYYFDFAGSDGQEVSLTPPVRVLSNEPEAYPMGTVGSYWGIAGMPAMVNRVTTLDYATWSGGLKPDLSNIFMGVDFVSDLPTTDGLRRSVAATGRNFGPTPSSVTPSWAPIPMVDMKASLGENTETGSFLFDTGAQLSMLSEETAQLIGLDSNQDGVFDDNDDRFYAWEAISGIGGTAIDVPTMVIDKLSVPTNEGDDLTWTDARVLILDIHPDIDGIFGSDLLTSGWFRTVFEGGEDGYIDQVQLDFRGFVEDTVPTGTIYFDLNDAYLAAVPEPSTWVMLLSGGLLILWRRLRRRWA